ncbi:hypothetical protein GCM10023097_78440 [Streptomyces collinus]
MAMAMAGDHGQQDAGRGPAGRGARWQDRLGRVHGERAGTAREEDCADAGRPPAAQRRREEEDEAYRRADPGGVDDRLPHVEQPGACEACRGLTGARSSG